MSKSSTITKLPELTTRDELKISAAIQQLFWSEGSIPSVEKVTETLNGAYPVELVQDYFSSQDFQDKLERLGLKEDSVSGLLTPEQLLVANAELNFLDRRSIRQKLDEINKATGLDIKTSRYQAWTRDPVYRNYVASRVEDLFKNVDVEAYKTLIKAVQGGDLKAVEMLFTMKGKYSKTINVNLNVEQVLVKVIEIVARHVDDPEVLENIAGEIEVLTSAQ